MPSVLISGATGFVAQHIIKQLLQKGYSVVGTVRSASKGSHLKNLFSSPAFSYEVVPDLGAPGAFDDALMKHPEVTVFLHTASPLNFDVADIEEELLKPAVEGTKNVFAAIKAHGPQIAHVVVTSSLASMFEADRLADVTHVVTEESWNPVKWEDAKNGPVIGYQASKKFAEKAAWDFFAEEKPPFKLNVVCPAYIFGPQAFDSEVKDQLNLSSEVINQLLKLQPDSELPEDHGPFPFIDVRDVAQAHITAFEKNLSGYRFILSNGRHSSQIMLDILNENFECLRGKLPVGVPASDSVDIKRDAQYENLKTREALGFPFRDLKTTVIDAASQILEAKQRSA